MREVANSLYFVGERGDTICADVMTKEVHLRDTEEAFVGVDDNTMLGKSIENSSEIGEMLLGRRTGDEDVIDVAVC